MIEDDLRAVFARHEELTPPVGPVREAIDKVATRRRRRRLAVRAAGAVLAVLTVVTVPTVGRSLVSAPASEVPVGASPAPTQAVPDRALNFLLLGIEQRGGTENGARADSILIVHVPRDRSRAYLISIPRDLGVEIPGHGRNKINAAFYHGSHRAGAKLDFAGGAGLTARTLAGETGLRFDGTATLTFTGLRRLTDAVGGVRMCLDHPIRSVHTRRVFPAGCQDLDGRASMDLLRQRYGMEWGGHDRDRNAQRFAKALLAKLVGQQTVTDPTKLMAIAKAVGDGLTLDTGDVPLAGLLTAVASVATVDPVGIGWTFGTGSTDGWEELDPQVAGSLFEAMRQDRIAQWVTAHPRQVTR